MLVGMPLLAPSRSHLERSLLAEAHRRLAPLALYPRPLRTGRIRLLSAPWFFAVPGLRRFAGYELGPLLLVRAPLHRVGVPLVVHELCHVWQHQHRPIRMWLSYLWQGYRLNEHEVEARWAARVTRRG